MPVSLTTSTFNAKVPQQDIFPGQPRYVVCSEFSYGHTSWVDIIRAYVAVVALILLLFVKLEYVCSREEEREV